MKDVVTGGAKMVAGGLGAIPTAIGKGLEQTPGVVGKAIGAVPVNPPDLGSNPSAKLAGEGYDQFARGIGGAASGARKGIMSALDLKEAPVAQTPMAAPVAQAPKSSVVTPTPISSPPVSQPIGVKAKAGGIAPSVAGKGVTAPQPVEKEEGLKRWVDETGTIHLEGRNLGIKKPEVKKPLKTVDDTLNELLNDPKYRKENGELKSRVLSQIVELQKAKMGIESDKEGQKITTRTVDLAYKKFKQENDMADPRNQLKFAKEIGSKIKSYTRDPETGEVASVNEEQSILAGLEAMKASGIFVDDTIMRHFKGKGITTANRPPLTNFNTK